MKKKHLTIIISMAVIILILLIAVIYLAFFKDNSTNVNNNPNLNNNAITNNETNTGNNLNLPTEGNNTILTTNSLTTLRVINEYDKSFFTKDKNLLIMFGSWCPNCEEELVEIEKILDYYKDNKDVNVIVIAHEFEDTINDLISLVEDEVDFGDAEVKIDLKRIIRKTIDPEASTVPISYVVDKNGNVLEVLSESITLEKAKDMIG